MTDPKSVRVRLWALIVCVCLTSAAFAGGAGPTLGNRKGEAGALAEQIQPLFIQVPPEVPERGKVVVAFTLDGRAIGEQTVIVRAARQGLAEILPGAGDILQQLRAAETKKEGSVMMRVTYAGNTLASGSLTQFDEEWAAIQPGRGERAPKVGTNGWCEDDCDLQAQECFDNCDQRGSCQYCHDQWADCLGSCPTCSDWEEVNRTRVGRQYSGSSNILGIRYCIFDEYYVVEETNPAGCYPNRFVCDYDTDTIYYGPGSGQPTESQCCNDDPNDENYCGGESGCPL